MAIQIESLESSLETEKTRPIKQQVQAKNVKKIQLTSINKVGNTSTIDSQQAKKIQEIQSKENVEPGNVKGIEVTAGATSHSFFDVPTNKKREFNEEDLDKDDEYDNNEDFDKSKDINTDSKQEEHNKSKYSNRPKAKLIKEEVDLAGNK